MHLSLLQVKLLYSKSCFANTKFNNNNNNKNVFGEMFEIQTVRVKLEYFNIYRCSAGFSAQTCCLAPTNPYSDFVQTKRKETTDAIERIFVTYNDPCVLIKFGEALLMQFYGQFYNCITLHKLKSTCAATLTLFKSHCANFASTLLLV